MLRVQLKHAKGILHWRQLVSVDMKLPVDPRQMPDTFIYLCKGPASKDRCGWPC